jgi:acetyl esterase/lipase
MTRARRAVGLLTSLYVIGSLLAAPTASATSSGTPATPLPADAVQITRNVEYASAGGVTLTLDVYQAAASHGAKRPGVILLHGGAWGSGKAGDVDDEARLFAREGWVGFSVSYRLADQTSHPWPDELTDVQRSVRWVAAHAPTYAVDPTKLVLFGVSAGGQLAILAGELGTTSDGSGNTIDDADPPANVAAVAAWSPPTKLSGLATPDDASQPPDCGNNQECIKFWRLPLVRNFIGCSVASCPDEYAAASPVSRADPSGAPIWWSNATHELIPLIQAQDLDRALSSAHVLHRLDQVDGSGHGDNNEPKVWNDMMAWLAARLHVPLPPPISFAGRNLLLSPVVVISVILGLALLIGLLAVALRDDEGEL